MKVESYPSLAIPENHLLSGDVACSDNEILLVSGYSYLSKYIDEVLQLFHGNTDKASVHTHATETASFPLFSHFIYSKNLSWQELIHNVKMRREELQLQKDHWSSYIENHHDKAFTQKLNQTLEQGFFAPSDEGCGSAYFLSDKDRNPQFIIKPVDEDIFCLNNRKGYATPFHDTSVRVRDDIPLYRSAQTDAACYVVAKHLDLTHITPKTMMCLVDSNMFYDLTSCLSSSDRQAFINLTGLADTQKLCSVQEFVPDSSMMMSKIYEWLHTGMSEEEMDSQICPHDFEDANLFLWTTLDTDGHPGNFLLYPKSHIDGGKEIFGIKKIDNGLSFPEKNTQFTNFLMYFGLAKRPLSDSIKQKIINFPLEQIVSDLSELELSVKSAVACAERIRVLQELAQRDGMTPYEINLRMILLGKEDGLSLALNDQSLYELEISMGIRSAEGATKDSNNTSITK
jgi:hypothetical protein